MTKQNKNGQTKEADVHEDPVEALQALATEMEEEDRKKKEEEAAKAESNGHSVTFIN